MMKVLGRVLTIMMVLVLVWFALSYAEVLCKNLTPNPSYCQWNFFEILIDKFQ